MKTNNLTKVKVKKQVKDDTGKNIKCHFMGSAKEKETISYLLHQEGAKSSSEGELIYIQIDE